MNRQILYLGIGLFVGGMVINAIVGAATNEFGVDPLDGIGGLLTFVGLILIIVGAVKGERGAHGQQQQQQVVVYAGAPGEGAPAAPRLELRCPTCRTLNERVARFCMECGHEIPQPKATTPKRASTGSRGRK